MPSPVLVKHIMSSPVIGLFAEQTLPLAEDIMNLKHLRHIPVLDDDRRLVGLVSHRDLLKAKISTLTGLTPSQQRARQEDVRISALMTRDVWTVQPETLASVAGRTLLDHKFGCLPVVSEDGVVVGIITERDFLKFAIKAVEQFD
ncbi:MAG: CBS domain-containing protein [Myxococcales bacterium]|nr:CBS domain-containing protein [Myxococcales bacterium]